MKPDLRIILSITLLAVPGFLPPSAVGTGSNKGIAGHFSIGDIYRVTRYASRMNILQTTGFCPAFIDPR